MNMFTALLLHILVIHCLQIQTYGSSDDSTEFEEEESDDSVSLDDEAHYQWYADNRSPKIIKINQKGESLQFSGVTTLQLPNEYEIRTILQIITSSELAKQLALEDKNRRFHRIPLKDTLDVYGNIESATKPNHYQIQLAHLGDFCFIKLPSDRTGITSSDNSYCFRVIPHNSLLTKSRVIYIEQAMDYANNLKGLKEIIQQKVGIASKDTLNIKVAAGQHQQSPKSPNLDTLQSSDTVISVKTPTNIAGSTESVVDSDSDDSTEQISSEDIVGNAQQKKTKKKKKEDEEGDDDKEEDYDEEEEGEEGRRRMGGDDTDDVNHHSPTVIGINVAFETRGILINELKLEKLLFLIQHIIDRLLPFLSSNDLIITLPVSNKLKHYGRATVSERVTLIVHKARKKRKQLNEVYELQYSTNTQSTFGGRIILGMRPMDPQKDVPFKWINLADFVISIGSLPNNADIMGISVRSINEDHVCFSPIQKFGYDNLFIIANKMGKCILHSMDVRNINDLHIYITNDGDNTDLNADDAKQNPLIEFELKLEEDECCLIEISQQSMYHKLYKDDGDYKNRQIILVKANKVTVIPSSDLLSSKSIHIEDIVFYVDIIGDYTYNDDWSSHSKIESLHYLLYSSKEHVSIPIGLWYLCVSWTQTIQNKRTQTTKCSDNLYFNVNFLLNELNHEMVVDNSGFLTLQLVHLQSLYKTIGDIRNELNEERGNEKDLYHNLLLHQIASSSDKNHLKQIEEMYQRELDKNGENRVEREDLKNQLKVLEQRLQNDEEFEKQYDKSLEIFAKSDINDPLKKRKELMNQIINSRQQIIRLRLEIRQKQQILESLQQHIDSIQIHKT